MEEPCIFNGNPKLIPMPGVPTSKGCVLFRKDLTTEEAIELCTAQKKTVLRLWTAGNPVITSTVAEGPLVCECHVIAFAEEWAPPQGGRPVKLKKETTTFQIPWTGLSGFLAGQSQKSESAMLDAALRVRAYLNCVRVAFGKLEKKPASGGKEVS